MKMDQKLTCKSKIHKTLTRKNRTKAHNNEFSNDFSGITQKVQETQEKKR